MHAHTLFWGLVFSCPESAHPCYRLALAETGAEPSLSDAPSSHPKPTQAGGLRKTARFSAVSLQQEQAGRIWAGASQTGWEKQEGTG